MRHRSSPHSCCRHAASPHHARCTPHSGTSPHTRHCHHHSTNLPRHHTSMPSLHLTHFTPLNYAAHHTTSHMAITMWPVTTTSFILHSTPSSPHPLHTQSRSPHASSTPFLTHHTSRQPADGTTQPPAHAHSCLTEQPRHKCDLEMQYN